MKKFWNNLKLIAIFVCFVLLLLFLFFDIIDWVVPGDFPDWLYVVDTVGWAVFAVLVLVMFIKDGRKQRNAPKG